ncbi:MAG: response regulator [Chloracidobacterium sp.]|nr:response regulator [Chloracidobacterium sp.]MDW8218430.1 response regulator [Acidobacteriota bacterium]
MGAGKVETLETVNGVITDFQMPRLDGIELARRLRRRPDLPILGLSGTLGPPKGCADVFENIVFLQKPFEIAELLDAACRLFLATAD